MRGPHHRLHAFRDFFRYTGVLAVASSWQKRDQSEKSRPGTARFQIMKYCDSPYLFHRRQTREVIVGDPARGGIVIGGEHPVVMQSMLTCDTMDTAASV